MNLMSSCSIGNYIHLINVIYWIVMRLRNLKFPEGWQWVQGWWPLLINNTFHFMEQEHFTPGFRHLMVSCSSCWSTYCFLWWLCEYWVWLIYPFWGESIATYNVGLDIYLMIMQSGIFFKVKVHTISLNLYFKTRHFHSILGTYYPDVIVLVVIPASIRHFVGGWFWDILGHW